MAAKEASPFRYSQHNSPGRVLLRDLLSNEEEGAAFIGQEVSVGGWIRSGRLAEKDTLAFISLNDGTWYGRQQFRIHCEYVVLYPYVSPCSFRSFENKPNSTVSFFPFGGIAKNLCSLWCGRRSMRILKTSQLLEPLSWCPGRHVYFSGFWKIYLIYQSILLYTCPSIRQ